MNTMAKDTKYWSKSLGERAAMPDTAKPWWCEKCEVWVTDTVEVNRFGLIWIECRHCSTVMKYK